jgi:hypothetical protein
MELMALMTGFGLAAAAGGRACLVLAALGCFHYSPWFELGSDYAWVASPIVICVAFVLAIVEILADAHPEISELVALASYLPKFVVGFIALSAATGSVDATLLQLAASGVAGGGTAMAVHYIRSELREMVHALTGDVDAVNSGYSWLESGGAMVLAGTAVAAPVLGAAAIVVLLVAGIWSMRRMRRAVDRAVEARVESSDPKAGA